MGLSWNTLKKSKQWDKYLDVRGFDECNGLSSGRVSWESYYPSRGLNFYFGINIKQSEIKLAQEEYLLQIIMPAINTK